VKPAADRSFIRLIQVLVPVGLRGLFLAALFGAIQSTINSVLNSTATILTLDIYRRWMDREASDRRLVVVGVLSSVAVLAISIFLGGFVGRLGGNLFVYIQSLYAFFAPPFSAVFLLGIFWRRTNALGALTAVVAGFSLGIGMKVYCQFNDVLQLWLPGLPDNPVWLEPYANQGAINWFFCAAVCGVVSLLTAPPRPEQVTDELTINWRRLSIFTDLGTHWYNSVVTWWLVFAAMVAALVIVFSGFVL